MKASRWPVLAALSLIGGFAWGRYGASCPEPSEPKVGIESTSDGNRPVAEEQVPASETASESTAVSSAAAAEESPSAESTQGIDEIAAFVESLVDANEDKLARLRWDPKAQAVLQRLRATSNDLATDRLPPHVLAELLSKLLERAKLPLDVERQRELDRVAAEWTERSSRELDELGDDALALERELAAIVMTDAFLEAAYELLDARQREQIDAWTPDRHEWPPILSPLTGAPVVRIRPEDGDVLRERLSRDLARDFGLDPETGDRLAAAFFDRIRAPMQATPPREEIVEHVVEFGEANLELFLDLLELPQLDAAAHRRIETRRHWWAPRSID